MLPTVTSTASALVQVGINYFSSNTDQKKTGKDAFVAEGMTSIISMGLLQWYPVGTKIRWKEHHIHFQPPTNYYWQGIKRWKNGESRLEIGKFVKALKVALDMFPPPPIPYNEFYGESENKEKEIDEEDPKGKQKETEEIPYATREFSKNLLKGRIMTIDDLHPLTFLYWSAIEGLIALSRTYELEPEQNLSLLEKPKSESEVLNFFEWRNKNESKFEKDDPNKIVAEKIHEATIYIKLALVHGHIPEKKLGNLRLQIMENYSEDKFKGISDKFKELRKKLGTQPPSEHEYTHLIKSITEECECLAQSFSRIRDSMEEQNRL